MPGEPGIWYDRFLTYYLCPDDDAIWSEPFNRTVDDADEDFLASRPGRAGERGGAPPRAPEAWRVAAEKYRWRERADERRAELQALARQEHLRSLGKARAFHAMIARDQLERIALRNHEIDYSKIDDPREIQAWLQVLSEAIALESRVLGLPVNVEEQVAPGRDSFTQQVAVEHQLDPFRDEKEPFSILDLTQFTDRHIVGQPTDAA
jgi:hypothetical protein